MAEKYIISPIEHLLSLDKPSLHMFPGAADWPSKNLTIDQKRLRKRWGYLEDRDIGENIQLVCLYQENDGTRHTLYLGDGNLYKRETGTDETWSYRTETDTYTAKVASISGTTVTFDTGQTPSTNGTADGDYFILDDDITAAQQPSGGDTNWASIASAADGPPPTITLDDDYTGSTGSFGTSKTAYVRQVYTTPSSTRGKERWQVAVVADKFCFTNGDVNVQYWAGSNYAAALDATYATKAKYCIEYGNRLCLANIYDGGTAAPWTLRSSANGDPTKWSTEDTSAVDYTFIETDDVISGLGKVGGSLVVYKTESLLIGYKTAKATDPFIFPTQKRGIGCIAPYSIVEVQGTNMFLGRDDFYMIEGDHPEPIGERIRYKFKEIVSESERENVWGFNNALENEAIWIANTSEGKFAFVFDYKDREWGAYSYGDNISGAGRGAV